MNQLKIYYIDFPEKTMQYDVGTVLINNENNQVQNAEICCLLNAESYDIADYSDEISILVDDNGFYKSGLPVWSIKTPDGISLELIGKLLFVRNIETEYSIDFVSIKAEDIFDFRIGLKIELKGMKK
ncbi:hypothetical protein [Psychrobacillus sp. BL-248-WT-3]|uniref:hypothetical protein n=1 Tax=Psychrobacillus sp. BL-248-WT-3 TaxID=2725306 RepID=UPI001469F127|nr:hypothetical protein [Psychrobacillus sp. BL-248-WT-3]NME06236.1 hypothetical protein [Psychrobacillus sp. BL-248-WT-3]